MDAHQELDPTPSQWQMGCAWHARAPSTAPFLTAVQGSAVPALPSGPPASPAHTDATT